MAIFAINTLINGDSMDYANKKKSLSAFVQPIVNTYSEQTIGLEVLLRYRCENNDQCHYVSPVSALKELNTVKEFNSVTICLFRLVIPHMQAIKNSSISFLTFNIIPQQLVCDDFVNEVAMFKQLMPSGVNLILEVIEGYGVYLDVNIRRSMNQLSEHNVFFAIDDFGNKSLALRYIKQPQFSLLKLDKSLAAMSQGKLDFEKAIKSMVTITNKLGVKLVVEGVETQRQLTLLQRCGVQNFQGFFYARPCHIKEYFTEKEEVN